MYAVFRVCPTCDKQLAKSTTHPWSACLAHAVKMGKTTVEDIPPYFADESVAVTVDTGDQSATVSAAQSPGMFTYLSNYVSESIAAFQGFESWKPY